MLKLAAKRGQTGVMCSGNDPHVHYFVQSRANGCHASKHFRYCILAVSKGVIAVPKHVVCFVMSKHVKQCFKACTLFSKHVSRFKSCNLLF